MTSVGEQVLQLGQTSELSKHRWRVLVIASVGVFLSALDSTILAVGLPALSADLHLSFSEALWVQASYLLVVAILLIPAGRWGEKQGLYFVYWLGTLLFGVFSFAAGLSFNGVFLIGARVLQAVASALVLTTAAAIVAAVFPASERGRALGLNMLGSTVGQMGGPPIGGIIVAHLGWPWIFYIKVPLVAILVLAGWDLLGAERRDRAAAARATAAAARATGQEGRLPGRLRSERPSGERPRDRRPFGEQSPGTPPPAEMSPGRGFDVRGAALLGASLAALFVPLIFSPLWGWSSPRTIAPLGLAVVLTVLFIVAESRMRDPILDLGLFKRSRVFASATTCSVLYMAASYGVTIFTAVFLQVVQGRSAQTSGLVLLIQPAIMTLITPYAGHLSDRLGTRGLQAAGLLVSAAGSLQLAMLSAASPLWQTLAALATLGIGIGIFSTPNFAAIMGSVQRSELGVASGMFAASRFCGMGVSVAILGAIAASKLGPEGGRVILLGARASLSSAEAFVAGYREAMLVGSGISVIGAFISLIPGRRPSVATES